MTKSDKSYSPRKIRHILEIGNKWYRRKRGLLTPSKLQQYESMLQALDDSRLRDDRQEGDRLARQVEMFYQEHFKKNIWDYVREMGVGIVVALVVATIVRQMWFELYEIPTGSMRPTFEEKDHLTVTKTAFGLNIPLQTEHFYFDPALVQRTGIVIWSGDGIPHLHSESTFLNIFPYTKRYIKRCMGKPGDTLYFYGGKIYGYDRDGNDLIELRQNKWLTKLEHIPFINFEGRRSFEKTSDLTAQKAIFHQFNQAIGRLVFSSQEIQGEVFNGKEWIVDSPEAQRSPHTNIQTYSDLFGIRNFAEARLLNKEQLETLTPFRAQDMEEGVLYLELRHTPSLRYPQPLISERLGLAIKGYTTVIPLQDKHLKALMQHMYTCRFVVKDGKANSYSAEGRYQHDSSPLFPKVENGTYEFYYGRASRIDWGGIAFSLPSNDVLYEFTANNIQKLYNIGIDMSTYVQPKQVNQLFFPSRYVYFRDGALYTMGGVLFEKDDELIKSFHEREQQRERRSTKQHPYVAFKDYGPPINQDGSLDKAFIETFGLKIPDQHYLMLGDNHAMSQDSRYFGPIPAANLQGVPSLIIWPPSSRWGIPNQKPYPLITIPRLIVWSIVGVLTLIAFIIHRCRMQRPIFKKLP